MMFLLMVRVNDPLVPRAMFGILNTLLFFPSGAVYPIAAFPAWMKAIAAVDPFTYAVHGFKELLLKNTGLLRHRARPHLPLPLHRPHPRRRHPALPPVVVTCPSWFPLRCWAFDVRYFGPRPPIRVHLCESVVKAFPSLCSLRFLRLTIGFVRRKFAEIAETRAFHSGKKRKFVQICGKLRKTPENFPHFFTPPDKLKLFEKIYPAPGGIMRSRAERSGPIPVRGSKFGVFDFCLPYKKLNPFPGVPRRSQAIQSEPPGNFRASRPAPG